MGMMVFNIKETMKAMDSLLGVNGWFNELDVTIPKERSIVGASSQFKVISTRLYDYTDIELVQPDMDKCKGTHFESYLNIHGEGLHHLCYRIPKLNDFKKIFKEINDKGYETVLHAIDIESEGTEKESTCEFCYLKPPAGGLYIELNWADANTK
jgi:hypothetical protein